MVIGQYNNAACILHYIFQGKHNWKRYIIFTIKKAANDKKQYNEFFWSLTLGKNEKAFCKTMFLSFYLSNKIIQKFT